MQGIVTFYYHVQPLDSSLPLMSRPLFDTKLAWWSFGVACMKKDLPPPVAKFCVHDQPRVNLFQYAKLD